MKNVLRCFFLILLSVFTFSFTRSNIDYSIDDVVTAMKSGDASVLSRYFDNMVEISMPDKSSSYSRSQAELIMRDFFSSNGVKKFDVVHKGDSNGGQYCIGNLSTRNGDFRTVIYMKIRGEKQVLQELRFENKGQ